MLICSARTYTGVYWLEFAGEDDVLAAFEATTAGSSLRIVGGGIGIAQSIAPERIQLLAQTRAAGPLIGSTQPTIAAARELLESAALDRNGSVAVRARDIRSTTGIDTERAERVLGRILDQSGFTIELDNPDHVLRVLFADDTIGRDPAADLDDPLDPITANAVEVATDGGICTVGWLDYPVSQGFYTRTPTNRPFFQPGSMDPRLARTIVNLGRVSPGDRVLDPMCGTGGVLIEAALVGADPIGIDTQAKMVNGARQNVDAYADRCDLFRGDATRLPFGDDTIPVAVADVPYGRQSPIVGDTIDTLVVATLEELFRVCDRAVIVADRSWVEAARAAGWTVTAIARQRVHRSLTRFLHVLIRE